jgi:hypothetical protein
MTTQPDTLAALVEHIVGQPQPEPDPEPDRRALRWRSVLAELDASRDVELKSKFFERIFNRRAGRRTRKCSAASAEA